VILVFKIEEGPKVKVGQIKFKGNHAFSDRKLIRAMRHDPAVFDFHFISGISRYFRKTYDRQKLNEDLEVGVRGLTGDNGYFKVSVGDPILENINTRNKPPRRSARFGRTDGKAVNITIPIEEGERYRMGTLKIVSADPDKALSPESRCAQGRLSLKPGRHLFQEKVRKALENLRKIYGE